MRKFRVYGYVPSDVNPHYTPEDVLVAEVEWQQGADFPLLVTYDSMRLNVGIGGEDEIDPVLVWDEDEGYWRAPAREPIQGGPWHSVFPGGQRFSDIRFEVIEDSSENKEES